MQVYFYFQSKTMINQESLLYTALSLFAEIGGEWKNTSLATAGALAHCMKRHTACKVTPVKSKNAARG